MNFKKFPFHEEHFTNQSGLFQKKHRKETVNNHSQPGSGSCIILHLEPVQLQESFLPVELPFKINSKERHKNDEWMDEKEKKSSQRASMLIVLFRKVQSEQNILRGGWFDLSELSTAELRFLLKNLSP